MATDLIKNEIYRVESSNVGGIEYLTFKKAAPRLRVTFKHGGIYDYLGVPREVLEQVIGAESVGKAINTLVKPAYEFERVVEEDAV